MYEISQRMITVGIDKCYISEITIAELKFGAANSQRKEKNQLAFREFIESMQVVPILSSLDFYAEEKARLRKLGTSLDDFDLLIGSCAVVNDLILVTNNEKHFSRIREIRIENWAK